MDKDKITEVAFQIILHSGDARALVHEALDAMYDSNFEDAKQKLEDATDNLNKAHNAQTELLQQYASGEDVKMEVILVHAQDHLMTTMTLQEMANEFLRMYERFANLIEGK
ncbi:MULTISPECIES: PTS cellobiose transporter subunit IIA [Aerococcus]|uniref:PTS cellobiose transporter subunit IIA n=1 Tax=Aerococcus TaxID=1375 RepID=UPI000DCB3974|nr:MULTISPECIES: PTS cellobiose transporter subunit IIA [Aerococcus]KAA9297508.1 PTS cellobiose transporter subunit IIA [Aerococcus tenax]MDK6688172.1 PTS cellobiose transporter subunit IIA [Aerococcus urinae]MDK8132708.1 PTS cellobiose transporter subunit IIA [Aerococcus urinae]MDK8484371.1 PTS cellobiose transporter subunit IIA [Aerococcus urinae]MDL5179346.1 PTS cellobiose transporter subunit IIA [Aerococcus tenax]